MADDTDISIQFGADIDGVTSGVEQVKNKLREVGGAAQEAGEHSAISFAQIREMLEGLTSPLMAVRNNLGEIAEAFAAAFAVEKIADWSEEMGELGEKTERTSKILGLTTEEVGRLNYQFAMTGTSAERFNMMMGRFEEGLSQAASEGTGRVAESLRVLGLDAQQLIGMGLPEQMEAIADAVSRFQDSPTKTAAIAALGRGFVELIPLLDQGGEGMRALAEKADATNTVLDEGTVKALTEMNHGFVDLGAAIEGDGILAFEPFIDVVDSAVQIMRDLAAAFGDALKNGGDWAVILGGLADVLKLVLTEIVLIIEAMRTLASAAAGALNAVKDYFDGLGRMLHVFITNPGPFFENVTKASAEANAKVAADVKQASADWVAAERDAVNELKRIWDDAAAAKRSSLEAGNAAANPHGEGRTLVPDMNMSEGEKLQAQIDALTKSINRAKEAATGMGDAVHGAMNAGQGRAEQDMEGMLGQRADNAAQQANLTRYMQEAGIDINPAVQAWCAAFVNAALAHEGVGGTGGNRKWAPDFANWGHQVDAADAQTGDVMLYNNQHHVGMYTGASRTGDNGQTQYQMIAGNDKMPGEGAPPAGRDQWGGVGTEWKSANEVQFRRSDQTSSVSEMEEELAKLKTKQLELNQAADGGSATKKADLEIARAAATQDQNAVTIAERKLAAAKDDAEANRAVSGDKEKQVELDTKVATAQQAVLKATQAREQSELRLGVAKAKATDDPKAAYDAEMKLAEAKKAAAGADPTKQNEAMQQEIAAQTTYENALRERVKATSQAEIDAARETATATRTQLDEKLKLHQINDAQWLAGTKSALDQERTAVEDAYAKELAAAQANSTKKIEIETEEKKEIAALEQQSAQASAKAAEQTESQYESMIGGILSSFTSAMKGMISGHETFRQAMMKSLESLADKAIDMIEKVVVKWIAGEMTKTAATTTGEAARTAAQSAGSAAGGIADAAGILKSIFASAGQAFAGVFGFMAPVMGPAAAGPAAAAEATVISVGSGLASADIGMWSVPSDMTTLVHHNELIMPAAEAGAFRDMLSGGGAGGANVNVTPQVNFHVRAQDSNDVKGFYRNNQREIAKGIHTAVREGAHLGLKGLRR